MFSSLILDDRAVLGDVALGMSHTPIAEPMSLYGDGRDPHGTPRTRGKKGTVHAVSLIRPARFVNEAGVEVMVADGGQGPIQVCYFSAVSEKTGAVSPHGRRQPMLTRWLHKRCEANTRKHAVQGRAGLHEEGGGGVQLESLFVSRLCNRQGHTGIKREKGKNRQNADGN